MMRALISVGACIFVTSRADFSKTGSCVLNGAQAVNDLLDAGVYTWAATNRCQKDAGYVLRCEIDISSAIESVNRMANVIVRAVDECGHVKGVNPDCGIAAGKLTAHMAGMAASAGGIIQECPNSIRKDVGATPMRDELRKAQQSLQDSKFPHGEETYCMVNIKNSMNELFTASAAISNAKTHCDDKEKCAYDVLGIMSSLAGLAKFIMGTISHCTHGPLPGNFPVACSEHITNAIRQTTGFISVAAEVADTCESGKHQKRTTIPAPDDDVIYDVTPVMVPAQPRLYDSEKDAIVSSDEEERKVQNDSAATSPVILTLAALLPISALVSFYAGMRLSRFHQKEMSRNLELFPAGDLSD